MAVERQRRLFNPLGMIAQPHEQSFDRFAASPRNYFHGSDDPVFPKPLSRRKEGFHVGSRTAAEDRLSTRRYAADGGHMGYYDYPEDYGHIHPLRLNTEMKNIPDSPIPDRTVHWSSKHFNHFYRNRYEDPGSISAVLPNPRSTLSYVQFAQQAQKAGKPISREAEAAVAHKVATGEDPYLWHSHAEEAQKFRERYHSREQSTQERMIVPVITHVTGTGQDAVLHRGFDLNPSAIPDKEYRHGS